MKTVNEKIIKTFELLELVSINDYEKVLLLIKKNYPRNRVVINKITLQSLIINVK